MSYSESAYERYNELDNKNGKLPIALSAKFLCVKVLPRASRLCTPYILLPSEVYESRSPDGDLVPASWRPRPARDRSPAGTPVSRGAVRLMAN
ncbi:hypothetical protein F2Q69_00023507 [Brassica cretica]|uniref:Uncharacterized protein n=1 Tax=Brassica cretica TaxID=69181 RepID=A0A8S9QP07_BRACR|nr:hypothetical protein F2Q69_00023507 [Brassica cretica]